MSRSATLKEAVSSSLAEYKSNLQLVKDEVLSIIEQDQACFDHPSMLPRSGGPDGGDQVEGGPGSEGLEECQIGIVGSHCDESQQLGGLSFSAYRASAWLVLHVFELFSKHSKTWLAVFDSTGNHSAVLRWAS